MCLLKQGQLLAGKDELLTAESDDAQTRHSSTKVNQRTRLPRLTVPQFSGRFGDWPVFRDLFTSIVHENDTISNAERHHYLMMKVKDKAAALIRGMSATAESYTCA